MSLCTVCGRMYCDHTITERGQTAAEMMAELTPEEQEAFDSKDDNRKLVLAKRLQAERDAAKQTTK